MSELLIWNWRRWCGDKYKPNKFSHILGPQRTKKHSKRELKHYLILKIWGKHHIRSKSDQLPSHHSVFNKWWWCFSVAVVQGSLSPGVCEFILIHSHPFSLAPTCKRLQMRWKTNSSNWIQRGKTSSNPKCAVHTKIGDFRSVNKMKWQRNNIWDKRHSRKVLWPASQKNKMGESHFLGCSFIVNIQV